VELSGTVLLQQIRLLKLNDFDGLPEFWTVVKRTGDKMKKTDEQLIRLDTGLWSNVPSNGKAGELLGLSLTTSGGENCCNMSLVLLSHCPCTDLPLSPTLEAIVSLKKGYDTVLYNILSTVISTTGYEPGSAQ